MEKTGNEIMLKVIQEQIARQDETMQAHIRTCFQQMRALYVRYRTAGAFALALLSAEEAVRADIEAEE